MIYLTHQQTKHGDLLIRIDHDGRNELRAQVKDAGFQSDVFMYDTFEWLLGNSDLEWIAPEEIGALTDAPILGIVDRYGNGVLKRVENSFWYPNYCLRSPQEDLVEYGEVIFQKA